ncbi:Heparinase II/III-like protein [Brevibacterium sp. Mu109]|uniref:heparinase II/III domain-containing protein n=1 Tax=Brevibacterium sp. Mu109 TaxID=1255669 RepID=UPI000C4C2800|nr:heparinase II/III family protein [Brevibacterium sp. Mu109]SMX99878.1 Heparinase II/III-like protein [Brevibacterium sp. Mu109]
MTNYSREMAEKQAIGARFVPTPQDRKIADEIAGGTLSLFPHESWALPERPTWREDPFKDTNWVFQYHTLRWLDPLRRQASEGNPEDLAVWLRYAESWIEANPPGKGVSRFSWADMVDGARSLTFAFALPAIEDHRPESLGLILNSLEEHGTWLEDPMHIKVGNHALQQHQGLLIIGAVLEKPEWVDLALSRCVEMVKTAYDDQGMNEEGAPQYHHMNFTWWSLIRKRFEIAMGSSPAIFDRILKAPEGLAHATRPDGRFEMIGDTEEFANGGVEHPAVRYVKSSGRTGAPPRDLVKIFDRGYVFGRDSWGTPDKPFVDTAFYSLRFGHQKQIHGHQDGMALTLFKNRESFLLDSGKYSYDVHDPMRVHLLTREAHNSLVIKDAAYNPQSTVQLLSHDVGNHSQTYTFVDDGYSGARLYRTVTISLGSKAMVVQDRFVADRHVEAQQWWHFAPRASHRREGSSFFVRSARNEARFFVLEPDYLLSVAEGRKDPVQGWYSPTWKETVASRALSVSTHGTRSTLTTVVAFDSEAEHATLHHVDSLSDDHSVIHITRKDGTVATVVIGDGWGLIREGAASAQDAAVIIEDANLQPAKFDWSTP